ncbi:Lrp/AsnC family transcriptional regulator [Arenibaculum sp.]|jgi:Lrp/AsnC family transcriptional regulator|uniref:Lrp/AsnC family transcriptional regulator n=1 Tax=Arenibaculum sp. TaxID=2865862 RepID=UPI002E168927|nr:Lrp/AsnC family transcriptional regulator [Arenibaculum sp.]
MFDDKDRRILAILQENADTPVGTIAEEVGLSTTPCWRRIKRMEESGLIARRVALLDRRKANVPMTVFVTIRASRHSIDWLDAFRRAITDIPEVVEAYRLAGDMDYILRLVVPSVEVYDGVYKSLISRVDFVDVSASISMEELKSTTTVPTTYLT